MIIGNLSSDFPANVPFEVRFNSERGFSREYYAHRLEGKYGSLDEMKNQIAFPGRFFLTGNRELGYHLQIETEFKQYELIADVYPQKEYEQRVTISQPLSS